MQHTYVGLLQCTYVQSTQCSISEKCTGADFLIEFYINWYWSGQNLMVNSFTLCQFFSFVRKNKLDYKTYSMNKCWKTYRSDEPTWFGLIFQVMTYKPILLAKLWSFGYDLSWKQLQIEVIFVCTLNPPNVNVSTLQYKRLGIHLSPSAICGWLIIE